MLGKSARYGLSIKSIQNPPRIQPAMVKRKRPAEAGEQAAEEGCLALHCGKFVPWRPTAVLALAATGDGSVVALARESGDIEIWDTEIWHCIKASTLKSA